MHNKWALCRRSDARGTRVGHMPQIDIVSIATPLDSFVGACVDTVPVEKQWEEEGEGCSGV